MTCNGWYRNPLSYPASSPAPWCSSRRATATPSVEPITVQRRASNSGVIMAAGQKITLGRTHVHAVVTVHVAGHTMTVDFNDGARTFRRVITLSVHARTDQRPRKQA